MPIEESIFSLQGSNRIIESIHVVISAFGCFSQGDCPSGYGCSIDKGQSYAGCTYNLIESDIAEQFWLILDGFGDVCFQHVAAVQIVQLAMTSRVDCAPQAVSIPHHNKNSHALHPVSA